MERKERENKRTARTLETVGNGWKEEMLRSNSPGDVGGRGARTLHPAKFLQATANMLFRSPEESVYFKVL